VTGVGRYDQPTEMDRYRMIRDYFERLLHEVEEHPVVDAPAMTDEQKRQKRDHESAQRDAIGKMKQFASWFTHGVPGGATLRREIFEAKRGADVMDRVDAFFAARAEHAGDIDPTEPATELDAAPAWLG
jgi:tRNA-dihydrouridine synthase